MADSAIPGLGDLLSLFGGANPLGGIGKQLDQAKRLIGELAKAVENINATMETLNGTAQRVNGLLDSVEGPIKALMPQLTRSIKSMDAVMAQLSGPLDAVAPGLNKLAETLSSQALTRLPSELGGFLDSLGDIAKRLQPLAQVAESAGSLFGLRPLANLRAGSGRLQAPPAPPFLPPVEPIKVPKPRVAPTKKSTNPVSKKAAPKKKSS